MSVLSRQGPLSAYTQRQLEAEYTRLARLLPHAEGDRPAYESAIEEVAFEAALRGLRILATPSGEFYYCAPVKASNAANRVAVIVGGKNVR